MHVIFKWNKDASTNEGVKDTFFSYCNVQCVDSICNV